MMIKQFFDNILFSIGEWEVSTGQVIAGLLLISLSALFLFAFYNKRAVDFFSRNEIDDSKQAKLKRYIFYLIGSLLLYGLIMIYGLNFHLFALKKIIVDISLILKAFIILQIARVADWIISNLFIHKYYTNRDKERNQSEELIKNPESGASKVVQLLVYLLAAMAIISNLGLDATLFKLPLGGNESVSVHINNVLSAFLVLLIARLIVWLLSHVFLYTLFRRNQIDEGSRFAISQIVKYVIYVFAILVALRSLGINVTLIIGGAAALLVGIGLGLQQTFNDFFSGLVLLFERSVAVGDILFVDGKPATVKKIGLRSSIIESADGISNIVPNSRLVNNSVQNWTHFSPDVRFSIKVGVAYGSDTQRVKEILLQVADEHRFVNRFPEPFVRFQDFGDSALIFELYFYSRKYLNNQDVMSDLRFEIDRLFRENNINIPFPQRDIWIKENK